MSGWQVPMPRSGFGQRRGTTGSELSCQCSSENRGVQVATGAVGKVMGPVWDSAGRHWAGAPGQQHSGRTAWHEWLSASALTLYVLVH